MRMESEQLKGLLKMVRCVLQLHIVSTKQSQAREWECQDPSAWPLYPGLSLGEQKQSLPQWLFLLCLQQQTNLLSDRLIFL